MAHLLPLTMDDQKRIQEYFIRFPQEISEFTFTNLYTWKATRPLFYAELQNTLVFFMNNPTGNGSKFLFGAPVGGDDHAQIFSELQGLIAGAVRVPKWAVPHCREIGLQMKPDRNNADYVYSMTDLANLEGRRFSKKRNQIKQCLQHYDCRYEPLTDRNLNECIEMQEKWCVIKGCRDEPGLEGEYAAILETFAHYNQFPLIGGVIRVDGQVCAFAVAERLNETTAVWHFEKALPHVHGLGQVINQWFVRNSLQGFLYINREQDLGIAGLRQAKESYCPLRLVEKFTSQMPDQELHQCC